MTDSNRLQLAYIPEVTWATTPNTPEMTKIRVTGESLKYGIDTIDSKEIRSDRMTPDLIQVGARATGGFNFELSYAAFDDFLESVLFSTYQVMPVKLNLTADSSITGVTDSSDTFAVDAGGSNFKAGHLIRTSGFTNSANNGLFRVSSSTGTTIVLGGTPTLTDEAAPPAGARIKVIGFRGATADITATSTGLGSTLLDFTTLGLTVGQWVKVGGSTSGEQFATSALNEWMRITAIAATALTLDNRPSGWTTDNGTGKTITVYTSDYIRPGTTQKSFSIERGFLGQTVPSYEIFLGMIASSLKLSLQSGSILSGSFEFLGKNSTISTTALDSTPTEAAQNAVLNAVNNVGRVAENGSLITGPNYIQSLEFSLNNNLRENTAVGTLGLVHVGVGKMMVSGSISTYFGDTTLYQKYVNNTATSLNFRVNKSSKAMIFTFPNVKFSDGTATAGGSDQDVQAVLPFTAILDTTTNTNFQIDRFEEYA